MTSKSLFFNLLKEDLKRRIWSIALSTLIFIIILPIACSLYISTSDDRYLDEWELEELIHFIGTRYEILIIFTVLSAIILGISGYFYLQNRKKMDLYHSIPVRRELLFTVSYVNGLLIYFIPYIVNLVLCFIALQMNDFLKKEIVTAAITGIGIHFLFFCMIYTLTILAVMLTGNLIISFCGISVFLLYQPFIKMLKEQYYSSFFMTHFQEANSNGISSFLSPLESYINIAYEYLKGSQYIISLISAVVATIILFGLALLLYRKRPSEAAGKAMAFKVSKPIIKFLLVVPIALAGGLFLRSTVSYGKDIWFIFGIGFCFFISFAIIQVMYEFDIRSALHNKRQMLLCALTAAILASIFRFDIFGYDSYLPREKEIQSMSAVISGLNRNLEHYKLADGDVKYISGLDYELEKMELTDFDAAYKLAELGITSDINTLVEYEYLSNQFENNIFTYCVKFSLKNGREVYRRYLLKLEDCEKLVKDIYANQHYKEVHYPIFDLPEEEIFQVSVTYGTELLNYESAGVDSKENINYSLEGMSVKELTRIYKDELQKLQLDEIASETPVVELEFITSDFTYRYYYVYPSFINTLAFLENHGFDTTKELNPNKINEIIIAGYKPTVQTRDEMLNSSLQQSYTEQKDIAEIIPSLIEAEYYYDNSTVIQAMDYINVEVVYQLGENGMTQRSSYRIREDRIPDIIKKDFNLPWN